MTSAVHVSAAAQDPSAGSLVVLAVVLAALWAVPWYLRRRRLAADLSWAAERSWRAAQSDPVRAGRWRDAFGLAKSCVVTHVLAGHEDGRDVASFEIGDGYGWRGYRWHVVTMSLPVPLPTLELTPEVRRGRVAGVLGKQDLTFESAQFNAAWRVRADDPKVAHDILHPRVLERLLRQDARALAIRVDGAEIACWRWGPAVTGNVERRLDLLRGLVDSVPRFVWLAHGYEPGPAPVVAHPAAAAAGALTWRERFDDWWAVSVSAGASRRRRG